MFRAAAACAAKYCRNPQGLSSALLARMPAYYPVNQYRRQYRGIDLQPINASSHRSKVFRGLLTNLEPKSGNSRVELHQFTIQCIRRYVYRDTSSLIAASPCGLPGFSTKRDISDRVAIAKYKSLPMSSRYGTSFMSHGSNIGMRDAHASS